jgi:probable HAF family extracellular repeat protein
VGAGQGVSGQQRAVRWRDGAPPEDLGVPPGFTYSYGMAISGDGRVIVGDYRSATEGRAFVYTDKIGMVDLQTFLSSRGVELHGFALYTCFDLTPGADTLVGYGRSSAGVEMAWRAQVPGWF